MIDQLMMTVPDLSVTQQSEWLHKWGIDELVAEGSRYWEEHKSAPDIAAMKMRSRANEAQSLTGEDGLGAFSVLSTSKRGI
jgi:SAM-dependent MidA family methyltransferase